MPDVIDQLRSYGEAVEATVPPAAVPEPRNRRPFVLAAAALVLVACVGAGVWALRADDGTEDDGPVVDTTDVPVESGWQTLDPGPLEPREGAAEVWTGDELVVWGGQPEADGEGFADGAAYDPVAGEWRAMSPSPLDGSRAIGVWTGEEVLIWPVGIPASGFDAALSHRGAAWSPSTDRWREIGGRCIGRGTADACSRFGLLRPYASGTVVPVWTGNEMIDPVIGEAYNPSADSWRRLPARPVDGTVQASAWSGEELLVLVANRSDASYPVGEAVALSYSPADDVWTALPPTGVGETAVDLAWDGEEAVALDYEMRAATYDPDNGMWIHIPELPFRFGECSPRLARVGDTVLADHCAGQALLTEHRQWAIAPPSESPFGQMVSASDAVLSWASSSPAGPTFQAYTAPKIPEDDLALERSVPIGTVLLDLPDDARLTSTGLDEEVSGLVTGLSFVIQSGDVECHLTSTYAGIPAQTRIRNDASTLAAKLSHIPLEQVDIGRDRALVAQWPAGATDDRAHILVEETTSDVLDIACPDLPNADALLQRIHR